MQDIADSILSQTVTLAQDNPDVVALWLYGSRAEGRALSASDFDFAVAFASFPADEATRRLRPELLAIDWRKALGLGDQQLSVADINLVPIPLALNIIDAKSLLLSKDDLRVIREHNRIWGIWSDIKWRSSQLAGNA